MPIVKYDFQPGIVKEGTRYSSEGGYADGNLVRFKSGYPEKIGGWMKRTTETLLGVARGIIRWSTRASTRYIGIGTTSKYYILDGTALHDITPVRDTSALAADPIDTTSSSNEIVFNDTGHGAETGDYVIVSGAATVGGIPASEINAEHLVIAYTANTFTVQVTTNASSTTSGGGVSVSVDYLLETGTDEFLSSTGYGSGAWGVGPFGSLTAFSFSGQLRLWSHDNFGEDLVINPRGGKIYLWDASIGTGTRAAEISTLGGASQTPTTCLKILVSDQSRHVIGFGLDPISGTRTGSIDPMLIGWCDAENLADWNPASATNSAGEITLSSGSYIMTAVKTRQEILVFTDSSMYSMNYIGAPFVFGVDIISENSGIVSPNAAVSVPDGVFWMSNNQFLYYSGALRSLPCTVLSYVFDNLNRSHQFKIFAGVNRQFNEVWWFYPEGTSEECNRVVVFNYLEQVWWIGELSRSTWHDAYGETFPIGIAPTGEIYNHEDGYSDDGSGMANVYIETSDFDIDDGFQYMFVRRILPDIELDNAGEVAVVLKTRDFPNRTATTRATKVTDVNTLQHHVRARGRQAIIRYSSDDEHSFNIGSIRLDIQPDGRR